MTAGPVPASWLFGSIRAASEGAGPEAAETWPKHRKYGAYKLRIKPYIDR